MQRRLGTSGLSVTPLALGTMAWGSRVDLHDATDLVHGFLEAGGHLIDTAHGYGDGAAETFLGQALGSGRLRDEAIVCTKAGLVPAADGFRADPSRRTLMAQLDTSLARLGADHVDIWLVHAWSDEVPLTETLSALEWAVTTGRARYVGVSNHSGWQSARSFGLLESARIPLVLNEVRHSLLDRSAEDEVLPAAEALGFGVLAWSPLGRGRLAGNGRRRTSSAPAGQDRAQGVVDAVVMAARGLGVSPAEVALAWCRDRPGVTAPIIGARTPGHLGTAMASLALTLPPEIIDALDDVSAD